MIPVLATANERWSELAEIAAGLDANVIALDRDNNPIAVGNFLDEEGRSVVDPQYGFTPLEHKISNARFDEWTRTKRNLPEETIEKITHNFLKLDTVEDTSAEEVIDVDTTSQNAKNDAEEKNRLLEEERLLKEFNVSTLEGILENKTTLVKSGQGGRRKGGRIINEEFKWGPSLVETRKELGHHMPLKASTELLKGLQTTQSNVKEAREINMWYNDNKEKLAVAIATSKNAYDMWQEEGHVGLYKKYNLDYNIKIAALTQPSILSNGN